MKRIILLSFLLLMLTGNINASGYLNEFKNLKFGLFIHWGLYSETAGEWKGNKVKGGEHFMIYEKIPLKEYSKIAESFNPIKYNPKEWVKMAKRARMKYIIITAKHHDGFAMYDSECNNYNIVECTPYAKDPMPELISECKKAGLKFGFYYSLGRDWEDPDVPTNWPFKGGRSNLVDYPNEDGKVFEKYYERKVFPQVKELVTNYGDIDFIWFDTPELINKEQSKKLREMIKSYQPQCLINERIGNDMGDYAIVEQKLVNKTINKPWEACLTMGRNWGYNKFDTVYKKTDILLRNFVDIVSKGGNLLLNVGPKGDGTFTDLAKQSLEGFHDWLNINGEAIWNTSPWRVFGENYNDSKELEKVNANFHDAIYDGTPQNIISDFRYTCKNDVVYIIVRHVMSSQYILKSFNKKDNIKSIEMLGDANSIINWSLSDKGLSISLPKSRELPLLYVLKVNIL